MLTSHILVRLSWKTYRETVCFYTNGIYLPADLLLEKRIKDGTHLKKSIKNLLCLLPILLHHLPAQRKWKWDDWTAVIFFFSVHTCICILLKHNKTKVNINFCSTHNLPILKGTCLRKAPEIDTRQDSRTTLRWKLYPGRSLKPSEL